jgi:hypothetical protein
VILSGFSDGGEGLETQAGSGFSDVSFPIGLSDRKSHAFGGLAYCAIARVRNSEANRL